MTLVECRTGMPAGYSERPTIKDPFFLSRLLAEVATKHRLTAVELKSERRLSRYCVARSEFCYRAYMECNVSLVRIGRVIGGRDHTTVRNSIARHCQTQGLPLPSGVTWGYWVGRRGGDVPPQISESSTFVSIGDCAVRVVEKLGQQVVHDSRQEA